MLSVQPGDLSLNLLRVEAIAVGTNARFNKLISGQGGARLALLGSLPRLAALRTQMLGQRSLADCPVLLQRFINRLLIGDIFLNNSGIVIRGMLGQPPGQSLDPIHEVTPRARGVALQLASQVAL